MTTKISSIWMLACAISAAKPGDLDRNFHPELRAWVAPDQVTLAADGRAWIGGGFDRGDGKSVGDLLRLGENGGVAGEPAVAYLKRVAPYVQLAGQMWVPQDAAVTRPFLLENGDFLLSGESGGWLRMNAAGKVVGKAFADRQTGESIAPQFERDGKLWVIRQLVTGGRILERRVSADGTLDAGFSQLPQNVNTAVPGPDGGAWVLAGEGIPWDYFSGGDGAPLPEQRIFRVATNGRPVAEPRVIVVPQTVTLVAGPAGAFRLVYGADQSGWLYWPAPTSATYKIEWYSATGLLGRGQDFSLRLFETFAWAEAADGSLVATDARTQLAGSSQYFIAKTPSLRRYGADGVEDLTFASPGAVRSVKALADGKWLIDGLRRLNANGSEDPSWTAPELSRPAVVKLLLPLPDGRVLVAGDFAMADGLVRNRLVVFLANGKVDRSFIPDERIGEWRSLTVSGRAIYVVTNEPVVYGNAVRSNLVKLGLDGTLDESFEPLVPQSSWTSGSQFQTVSNVDRVTGMAGGDILVETYAMGGDIAVQSLARLKPDGSRNLTFRRVQGFGGFRQVLALANGGFAGDGTIYQADGSVAHDLSEANSRLTPLCETPGGILFKIGGDFTATRLALWTRHGFACWFRPPALDWSKSVTATAGEWGTIYLAATRVNGKPSIHRLLPNGQIDRSFRGPVFENRERQSGRDWWKAEEGGKVAFDPTRVGNEVAALYFQADSQVLLWHPASRRLWTGGNFNMVGGQPRDGLARISGGFSWLR